VHIEQEAGLTPELVWLFWGEFFFLAPARIWTMEFWACGIVTKVCTYSNSWQIRRSTGRLQSRWFCVYWVCSSELVRFTMALICGGLRSLCQKVSKCLTKIFCCVLLVLGAVKF
jgi:hypothetical protein